MQKKEPVAVLKLPKTHRKETEMDTCTRCSTGTDD